MTNGQDEGGQQPPYSDPSGQPQQPYPQQQGYPPPQGYGPPPGQGAPPGYGSPPQGYPPQGYPPQQGYGPSPAPPNNTLAVVSMVSGIAGLTVIPFLASIVAVITGHLAKGQIRRSEGREGGDGMATAGLVTGYIGIAFWGFMILIGILLLGWFIEEGPEFIEKIEELTTPTPTPFSSITP